MHEIGKNKDYQYKELVEKYIESDFELIKETAVWAHKELRKKV